MADSQQEARDTALRHLDTLIRRGRELEAADLDPARPPVSEARREWQQQCAAAITHLSGGSKAHWLSRAFSDAFLVRAGDGAAATEAAPAEIVRRIVEVLAQARASLLGVEARAIAGDPAPGMDATAAPRRFGFVHRRELQPVLERALTSSQDAFDRADYTAALVEAAAVLDAILTDALEHAAAARDARDTPDRVPATIAAMSLPQRIAAAESAGLIRGSCARLPENARRYHDAFAADGTVRGDIVVLARDAKVTLQVVRTVMRDLDPGR